MNGKKEKKRLRKKVIFTCLMHQDSKMLDLLIFHQIQVSFGIHEVKWTFPFEVLISDDNILLDQ